MGKDDGDGILRREKITICLFGDDHVRKNAIGFVIGKMFSK